MSSACGGRLEDDTLYFERTGVSFGGISLEPFLLAQERFYFEKCLYNVKDLAFLRGLSINTARQMTGEHCLCILPVNGFVLAYLLYTSLYENVNKIC